MLPLFGISDSECLAGNSSELAAVHAGNVLLTVSGAMRVRSLELGAMRARSLVLGAMRAVALVHAGLSADRGNYNGSRCHYNGRKLRCNYNGCRRNYNGCNLGPGAMCECGHGGNEQEKDVFFHVVY